MHNQPPSPCPEAMEVTEVVQNAGIKMPKKNPPPLIRCTEYNPPSEVQLFTYKPVPQLFMINNNATSNLVSFSKAIRSRSSGLLWHCWSVYIHVSQLNWLEPDFVMALGGGWQVGSSVATLLLAKRRCFAESLDYQWKWQPWESPWGSGVVELKNDSWLVNLSRARLPFTWALLREGTFCQKQHLPHLHSTQIKFSSNWWQDGIIQNKASLPFQHSPLLWKSGKLGSCSKVGLLKSFENLVVPPEVAAASFTPQHWKTNSDKVFEINKLTSPPASSSVKWRHQHDKVISKVPAALTQTTLWFGSPFSVRLSHCS